MLTVNGRPTRAEFYPRRLGRYLSSSTRGKRRINNVFNRKIQFAVGKLRCEPTRFDADGSDWPDWLELIWYWLQAIRSRSEKTVHCLNRRFPAFCFVTFSNETKKNDYYDHSSLFINAYAYNAFWNEQMDRRRYFWNFFFFQKLGFYSWNTSFDVKLKIRILCLAKFS